MQREAGRRRGARCPESTVVQWARAQETGPIVGRTKGGQQEHNSYSPYLPGAGWRYLPDLIPSCKGGGLEEERRCTREGTSPQHTQSETGLTQSQRDVGAHHKPQGTNTHPQPGGDAGGMGRSRTAPTPKHVPKSGGAQCGPKPEEPQRFPKAEVGTVQEAHSQQQQHGMPLQELAVPAALTVPRPQVPHKGHHSARGCRAGTSRAAAPLASWPSSLGNLT